MTHETILLIDLNHNWLCWTIYLVTSPLNLGVFFVVIVAAFSSFFLLAIVD